MGLIRLLLALAVLASHCGPILGFKLIDSGVAVESFFIISGFYMSLILSEKYIGQNNSYSLFITNRFVRLFPIYWIALLATLFFCLALTYFTHGEAITILSNYISSKTNFFSLAYLTLTNIAVFGQGIAMFLGIDPESGNLYLIKNLHETDSLFYNFLFVPQAWTLALELSFYLIAPFILRKSLKIVIALIVLSLIIRLIMFNYLNLQNDPWSHRFFPTELIFFLSGYLSYRMYAIIKNISIPNYLSLLTFICIVTLTIFHAYLSPIQINGTFFHLYDLIYFLILTLSIPIIFKFLSKSKIDNTIGELSYLIYISHMLIAWFCIGFGSHYLSFSFLKESWAIGIVTITVSYLLNIFIASPIEKYRQSRLKMSSSV